MKDYALWRLRDKPGQRTLSAFAVQPLSRSAPAQAAAPAHLSAWSPAAARAQPPGPACAAHAGAPEQPGHEHGNSARVHAAAEGTHRTEEQPAPAHLAWSPAAASAQPGPARAAHAGAPEQPGLWPGSAGDSSRVHIAVEGTAEQPVPVFGGEPAHGAALDPGAGRSADAVTPAAPVPASREPDQVHEAAAPLPAHEALHSALQGRSGSDEAGVTALIAPASSPEARCAAADGQAEPAAAAQQRPQCPEAEPAQAGAPHAAGQLPARETSALACVGGPAVWDGPAWPGEEPPLERQGRLRTAVRSVSEAAPDGTGVASTGAAAGPLASACGAGPCAERADPRPSSGCSAGSTGDGREDVRSGGSRSARAGTSTSRPNRSSREPIEMGRGGDARVHSCRTGASPGWRAGSPNDAVAGMRPRSARARSLEAAMPGPHDNVAWSSPKPPAGLAVSSRAAADEGADQQARGGGRHGAVQPRPGPNPGAPVGVRTAEQISAAARAAKDILKGPPRSSRDDPAFQQTFWQASRLHFIGSWKA